MRQEPDQQASNGYVPLVRTTRKFRDGDVPSSLASTTDAIHFGAVAVVDKRGELLYSAGDPSVVVFPRSASKVFQTIPFVESGGIERMDFGTDALALMCASHNGERLHIDLAETMIKRSGVDIGDLRCGCQIPNYYSWNGVPTPVDLVSTQLDNTCSGKHVGFLAWCKIHGVGADGYLDYGHPLQRAVRQAISQSCEVEADRSPVSIDNCSAPNYAMPLRNLALGYAKLSANDRPSGDALATLGEAIVAHPYLGSGMGRNDLDFMTAAAGDWVSKIGAGSIQTIGIRSEEIGIAVKVADGNRVTQMVAALDVVHQLGMLNPDMEGKLTKWRRRLILNHAGLQVAEMTAAFRLVKH
jgi:L-asparaginase II